MGAIKMVAGAGALATTGSYLMAEAKEPDTSRGDKALLNTVGWLHAGVAGAVGASAMLTLAAGSGSVGGVLAKGAAVTALLVGASMLGAEGAKHVD